jgi:hypothetical protein
VAEVEGWEAVGGGGHRESGVSGGMVLPTHC